MIRTWQSIGFIMVLALIALIVIETLGRFAPQPAAQPQPTGSAPAQVPPGAPQPSAADLAAIAAQYSAARTELWETSKSLTEALVHMDQAIDQNAIWKRDMEPLRSNADGQLIAARTDLLNQIAHLFNEQRPSSQELTLAKERLHKLNEDVDRQFKEAKPTRLAPEIMLEVRDLRKRSIDASQIWSKAVDQANAIVRESKRTPIATSIAASPVPAPSVVPPATPVLPVTPTVSPDSSAIAPQTTAAPIQTTTVAPDSRAQPTQTTPDTAGTVLAPQPSPTVERLDEAVKRVKDEIVRQDLDKEIARKAKQKIDDEEKARLDDDLKRRLAEAKALLVKESRSDEVQRILQPFLVRRFKQPSLGSGFNKMTTAFEELPMSLSKIEASGGLAESTGGLSALARIGSHRELSAPRWNYNGDPRTWSTESHSHLKKAQELLRRLGPTMVSEGMLSE